MVDGINVKVDWARNGSYAEYHDDVTPQTARGTADVSVEYGRDQTTALTPTVAGRGSFTLMNFDKKFTPRNPSSPLYGYLKPARPVDISRTVGGVTYGMFNGHTDDTPINPDPNEQTVSLTLMDWLADFRTQTITTQLHQGIRTGTAIGLVLDACGWSASLRDLDAGATIIPWWWEDNADAFTALEKIVQSEGPPALLTVGPDGEIVFRDRHHRLVRAASITSQGTWRATGTIEPVMQKPFGYEEPWRNIINTGSASVDVRRPGQLAQVWSAGEDTYTLTAGEQQVITATASDPFLNAVTPVAGTDYTLVSGAVTVRLITTSGLSTGMELTAGGAGAVLTGLQVRAQPLAVSHTVQVSVRDQASVDEYGSRSFPHDLPWCGPDDARAVLETAVALRAHPVPIATVRFLVGRSTAKAAAVLPRDLSDRVRIVEPNTFTDGDFHIESIAHRLTSVHDHEVVFGLESVPILPEPVFRFDTAGAGFNDGLFGAGLDDSASIFLFDGSSGHRFDEGKWAA